MGNPISKIRSELDQSDAEKAKMEERMNILEKMLKSHLEVAKTSMINGTRFDQEIDTGTIVEYSQQENISISGKASPGLEDAIKDFFGGDVLGGFEKVISVAVDAVLGNASMGEHEGTNMFIQWSDNALLRLDAYYYRWNFSSDEIIQNVEGASGAVVVKRVINLVNTDPQVLTWAISRQADLLGKPDEAAKMIEDAVAIIKKVSELQAAVHDIEAKESSEGIGQKTDQ